MSKCVAQKLFKTGLNPRYLAIHVRSKICDQTKRLTEVEVQKKGTCFDQVKPLHERDTHPISYVIMDLDGVILNSPQYTITSHEEYLMKWKKHLKTGTKYKIMGMRNIDAAKILTDEYDMPFSPDVYVHGVWQIQRSLYRKTKLTRGVDDLVCYFLKHRLPVAMISSANEKAFKIFYSKLRGLENNICHYVNADQVAQGKPNPEILIKAARMFQGGPALSQFLVIESSYQGALAAKAAGMQVIMLTDGQMPKEMQAAANVVLDDITKFDPTEFYLPALK